MDLANRDLAGTQDARTTEESKQERGDSLLTWLSNLPGTVSLIAAVAKRVSCRLQG